MAFARADKFRKAILLFSHFLHYIFTLTAPWMEVVAPTDEGSQPMSQPPAIPLCDLQTQFRKLAPQIEAAVCGVLRSGQVILGPEVAQFEQEVAQYCGAGYGVGCSSGSDALLLALHALDIGPGDEVILPPFTFFATVGAICRTGAKPVFADIDPDSFNIDPNQVDKKITPNTRAIMLVHLFGQCADMEPDLAHRHQHDIPIIEDAAQAIGAEYDGKRTGTLGAIACFSFYPSKNLGAYGDGGMVVTSDPAWAAKMACLRQHGMEPRYYHKYMGWNARLDAVQAAPCESSSRTSTNGPHPARPPRSATTPSLKKTI